MVLADLMRVSPAARNAHGLATSRGVVLVTVSFAPVRLAPGLSRRCDGRLETPTYVEHLVVSLLSWRTAYAAPGRVPTDGVAR